MSSALKYAVVGDEFIETEFYSTPELAIQAFNDISDEPFNDKDWRVEGYTADQIAEIKDYSERHPQ